MFVVLHRQWERMVARFWTSETAVMVTMAVLVGLGGGVGTVLFRKAIDGATQLVSAAAQSLGTGQVAFLFLPALGGLIVGLWIFWLKPQGPGQGVAGIMEAVALHGGRISARGAIGRVIGAVITIGSGGSAGPEDPSVQIGATFGVAMSRFFKLSESRLKTLAGCGAAAGLAAAFNAPIAGVFFAIEIILGEFSSAAVGFVVMSAVAGAVVSQTFLGGQPAFRIPVYELKSPFELILYGVLGVASALIAVLYINALGFFEDAAERESAIPAWVKPALGGLIVGVLAVIVRPEILGTGYPAIENAFEGPRLDWTIYLVLVFVKLIATTATLGTGGQGGLFAPSLFLGAMLGTGLGLMLDSLLPGLGVTPAAYGLVGMGAVLAGAVRAPITAIVLPFEMTNDYRIIVPLMTAAILSYLIAQRLQPDSVYTQRHRKRGLDLRARKDENLMREILVRDAMTPPAGMATVPATLSIKELTTAFQQSGHHGYTVLDDDGRLYGVVTLSDLERAVNEGQVEGTVADICTKELVTVYPDESLEEALGHMSVQDYQRIPVVDRRAPRKVLGALRRQDIIRAYSRALVDRTLQARHRERLRLEGITGSEFVEVDLAPNDPAVGKSLKELKLPPDTVFVSIRRGTRVIIPRGDTVLQAYDRVLAAATPTCVPDVHRLLKGQ